MSDVKTNEKITEKAENEAIETMPTVGNSSSEVPHVHGPGCSHGHHQAPFVRLETKVGRNDPCSCGSGKKHKKCCAS